MKWAFLFFTAFAGGVMLLVLAVLALALAPNLTVGSQAAPATGRLTCQQIVAQLEQQTQQLDCSGLPDSAVCYGNRRVEVKARGVEPVVFDKPGDQEMLSKLASISTGPLDLDTGEWGMALLNTRVVSDNAVVTDRPLIFLLYGATTIEAATDSSGVAPGNPRPEYLHAFYFDTRSVGLTPECRDLPVGGLMIDSPDGFQVSFVANGAEITIGSTVVLQAVPYVDMTVTVLEGKASVTSGGQTLTATTGQQATIPLGSGHNGREASGPPQVRDAQALALGLPEMCRILAWSGLNVPCSMPSAVPTPTVTFTPLPTLTPPPTVVLGPYVTANVNSNVRSGDSMFYPVVGGLAAGETAPVLGLSCTGSGWFYIQVNGRQGFISPAIVTLTGSIAGLPCVNPPPLPDSDGDGFTDDIDGCPYVPGIDQGCPPPTLTPEPTISYWPDLTVSISDSAPDVSCKDGCVTRVDFTVTNVGRANAIGPFVVAAYAAGMGDWMTEIRALEPGASLTLTARWQGSCYQPDCEITITADVSNVIPEESEANNSDSLSRIG
jgi:hypothetical protein